MNSPGAKTSLSLPQRVPENVPGDFYVEVAVCLQCCLPHGEAPNLLNDPDQPFNECYFRRQPESSEEIEQAISALGVSDICALRYGGSDPTIIDKLSKRNNAHLCDQTSEGQAWISQRQAANKKAEVATALRAKGRWWERLFRGGRPAK